LFTLVCARPKCGSSPLQKGATRYGRHPAPPDDRRGFLDKVVVIECVHHKEGEVHAAREDGVAHVPAPHGQALALALLEVASTHDGPPRVAGEHLPAGFHLVVEISEAVERAERENDVILSGEFSGARFAYLPTERDFGVILEVFSGTPDVEPP
jgi:hypothetical protein